MKEHSQAERTSHKLKRSIVVDYLRKFFSNKFIPFLKQLLLVYQISFMIAMQIDNGGLCSQPPSGISTNSITYGTQENCLSAADSKES